MSEVNPNRSDLDQQQIFQRAFNEDLDRIRVDAEISASIIAPPGLEVSISAVDDNIAIRNSGNSNELLINADGSINITNISGIISLPTGASTSTLQTTGNTSLSSINGKLSSTTFNSIISVNTRSNEGFSTGSSSTPAISNVSSIVLAVNLNRRYAYVFNQTGADVYLKLGTTAVIGEGIRLVNNSMYEILTNNLWIGSISAIKSGVGSVNLDIFEGTI